MYVRHMHVWCLFKVEQGINALELELQKIVSYLVDAGN